MKYIILFALTFGYSILILIQPSSEDAKYFELIFIYRAFNRLYHNPFMAAVETLGLLIYIAIIPI